MNSDKTSYIIYADLECLIKVTDGCVKNLEKSLTKKLGDHAPCGYSISITCAFDNIENKHTLYLGKDCINFFHIFKKVSYKFSGLWQWKNATVNKSELKLHQDATTCYICVKGLPRKLTNDKNY